MKRLFKLVTIFPLKIGFFIIDGLFFIIPVYFLQALSSFHVTKKNLAIAFPGLTKKEIRALRLESDRVEAIINQQKEKVE